MPTENKRLTRLAMPRLYVILDYAMLGPSTVKMAQQLTAAGVRLLQYRNKTGAAREVLAEGERLAAVARDAQAWFFVNDRPDVAWLAGADGVHVGQEDLSAEQARTVIGQERWVGVSTHNDEQFKKALETSADYIAVGPVFPTATKENPDPVVGLEFIRRVRRLTEKPIVAIGGITLEHAAEVIAAGADSVAVISDILCAADPAERAGQYLRRLETVRPAAAH